MNPAITEVAGEENRGFSFFFCRKMQGPDLFWPGVMPGKKCLVIIFFTDSITVNFPVDFTTERT